jgi:hypothetical protein
VALDRLLADLDDTPLSLDGADGVLTQSDAHEAIAGTLLWGPEARSRLLEAIASAATGNGRPLREMADDVRLTFEASGLTMGAFMAISCADAAQYWDALSPEQLDDVTQRVYAAAPRLGPWLWSPPHDASLPSVGLCAMQQARASRPRGRFDAAGAGEILVLATSGDPTTPAAGARRAAQDLADATVLTLDADHHLAYPFAVANPTQPGYRCVLDAVEGYLQNLRSPAAGSVCDA